MSLPLLIQSADRTTFHEALFRAGIPVDTTNSIVIEPDGQNIRIGQVRTLRKYLTQYGRSSRIILFYSFHRASIESQNALLKLLEDTAGSTYQFALQVNSIESVLSTIRSRCHVILGPKNGSSSQLQYSAKDFTGRNMFRSRMTVRKKEEAEVVLLELLDLLRSRMKSGQWWTVSVIKQTLTLLHLLKQNNLNPQLTVDQCLLAVSVHLP